jgi:hypothetical protein
MYYNLIQIRPNIFKGSEWDIKNEKIPHDREPTKPNPIGIGYYYYPRRMGKKRAFERLRRHLIKTREKDIKMRLKDIEELKQLKIK